MTTTTHAHHFDSIEQQREAVTAGMWLFLVTEVMFFGGLFLTYAVYRWQFPDAFAEGSHHLIMPLGAVNTGILLVSSYTVALSVQAAKVGNRKWLCLMLAATMALCVTFLSIKGYEYAHEFHNHHVPGEHFELGEPRDPGVNPAHVQIFFGVYFAMTGLHAAHMLIGLARIFHPPSVYPR